MISYFCADAMTAKGDAIKEDPAIDASGGFDVKEKLRGRWE